MHQCALITERQSERMGELIEAGMSHFDAVHQAQLDCPIRQVSREEYEQMMASEFIRHEEDI